MKSAGLLLLLTAQASASFFRPELAKRFGKADEPLTAPKLALKPLQKQAASGRTYKPKAVKSKVSELVSMTTFFVGMAYNGYGLWVPYTTPIMGSCSWGTFMTFRQYVPDAVNNDGNGNTGCLGGATSADMENWMVYSDVNGCANLADNGITFLGAARYPSAVGKGGMGYMFYNEYSCVYDTTPGVCANANDPDAPYVTNYGGRSSYVMCMGEDCMPRDHEEAYEVWATGKDQWISTVGIAKDPETYGSTGEIWFMHCLEDWTRDNTWCFRATFGEDGLSAWNEEMAFWPEYTQQYFNNSYSGAMENMDWYRRWMQLECAGLYCTGASYWYPTLWDPEAEDSTLLQITYRASSDAGQTWGDVEATDNQFWFDLGAQWGDSYTPCGEDAVEGPFPACGGAFDIKRDYAGGTHLAINIGLNRQGQCDYRAEGSGVYYCYSQSTNEPWSCSAVGGTGPAASMVDTWKVDLWESDSNVFKYGAVQLGLGEYPDLYVVTQRASHAETIPDAYDPCLTFTKGPEWNLDLYASQSNDGGMMWGAWMQLTDTIYYTDPAGDVNADFMGDEWAPRLGGCGEGKCVIMYTVPAYPFFQQPLWADNAQDTYVAIAEFAPNDTCDEGDVNQDGIHNVADIVLLVNLILENA